MTYGGIITIKCRWFICTYVMENNIEKLEQLIQLEGVNNQEISKIISEMKKQELRKALQAETEDLIYIPENPLIKEAQDLWAAESVAFGYNVLGTAFINHFTSSTLALSIAGPIVEKLGFFMWEFIKAYSEHKKTWKPISEGFKNNISNGIKNLLIDIGVHDTIYAWLMAYGITNDMAEPWLLAIASFVLALGPAVLVKYSGNELLHRIQKNCTKLYGFKREKYYEARFLMDNPASSKQLFEQAQKKFNLENHGVSTYNDTYYNHNIPAFSDRVGTVKDREIIDHITGEKLHNIEIVHVLPKKKTLDRNSLYNYFYTRKEKGRKDISDQEMSDIVQRFPYKHLIKDSTKQISFDREVAYGPEVRVTLDTITNATKENLLENVIEIKVYQDRKALIEVMKFMMKEGNLRLTTYGKNDLL